MQTVDNLYVISTRLENGEALLDPRTLDALSECVCLDADEATEKFTKAKSLMPTIPLMLRKYEREAPDGLAGSGSRGDHSSRLGDAVYLYSVRRGNRARPHAQTVWGRPDSHSIQRRTPNILRPLWRVYAVLVLTKEREMMLSTQRGGRQGYAVFAEPEMAQQVRDPVAHSLAGRFTVAVASYILRECRSKRFN